MKALDGFICAGCGRASFHMALAPYCYQCHDEIDATKDDPPRRRSGWRLTFWLMWDAVFHRKPCPHMQRAMELSNLPDKREDQL